MAAKRFSRKKLETKRPSKKDQAEQASNFLIRDFRSWADGPPETSEQIDKYIDLFFDDLSKRIHKFSHQWASDVLENWMDLTERGEKLLAGRLIKTNPLDSFVNFIVASVKSYDRTNDHRRHIRNPDCIRCKIVEALPRYAQNEIGSYLFGVRLKNADDVKRLTKRNCFNHAGKAVLIRKKRVHH